MSTHDPGDRTTRPHTQPGHRACGLLAIAAVALLLGGGARADTRHADLTGPAVAARLALDGRQVARLDAIYDRYATVRLVQQARIAAWRETLAAEDTSEHFDNARTVALKERIAAAERAVVNAHRQACAEARAILTPQQAARLSALRPDRRTARTDRHHQLLFGKPGDIWQVPVEPATAQRLSARGGAARPVLAGERGASGSAPCPCCACGAGCSGANGDSAGPSSLTSAESPRR